MRLFKSKQSTPSVWHQQHDDVVNSMFALKLLANRHQIYRDLYMLSFYESKALKHLIKENQGENDD